MNIGKRYIIISSCLWCFGILATPSFAIDENGLKEIYGDRLYGATIDIKYAFMRELGSRWDESTYFQRRAFLANLHRQKEEEEKEKDKKARQQQREKKEQERLEKAQQRAMERQRKEAASRVKEEKKQEQDLLDEQDNAKKSWNKKIKDLNKRFDEMRRPIKY